ncbi:MAG: HAD-superfamily hydrolase, subfamily variant 3 [Phycisphaerales bacterium]|nr:HAD-superfamily hydrolase, subfamily variant 3 [Phycisphaerales bacterium]
MGKQNSEVRLVVFDLGRVLVRICDNWQHACRVAGLPVVEGELSAEGQARLHALVCRAEVGALGMDGFAREVAPVLGITPVQLRALSDAYLLGAHEGAIEVVDELSTAGMPTACLTNTNDNHWRLMSDRSAPAYFPLGRLTHQFASHLLRLRKPEEAIYAHVERATATPPHAILFFDDIEENVAAARKRGWDARRIDPALDDPISQVRDALREHRIVD